MAATPVKECNTGQKTPALALDEVAPAITKIVPKCTPVPKVTKRRIAKESSNSAAAEKPLKCKHCPYVTTSPVSLGGHISKAHPGMSDTYNHKMQVRAANKTKRACR
jgi:hypothetical protein